MHKTIISIAALATIFTAAPALATDPAEARVAIRLSDLDLSRPGDAARLDRRIASAKEAVCGSYANRRADEVVRIDACRAAVDRQLEPRLAALRARNQLASR